MEALHLLDVVLGAAPDHRGALEASRDAHAALDAGTENFWLSSWLRRQIATLAERLA